MSNTQTQSSRTTPPRIQRMLPGFKRGWINRMRCLYLTIVVLASVAVILPIVSSVNAQRSASKVIRRTAEEPTSNAQEPSTKTQEPSSTAQGSSGNAGPPSTAQGPPVKIYGKKAKLRNFDAEIAANAIQFLDEGRNTFRSDTFGDEAFWGGSLQLHQAIKGAALGGVGPGISPTTALNLGLKVDVDSLPHPLQNQLKQGKVNLNDPATTVALIKLDAV